MPIIREWRLDTEGKVDWKRLPARVQDALAEVLNTRIGEEHGVHADGHTEYMSLDGEVYAMTTFVAIPPPRDPVSKSVLYVSVIKKL